MGLGGAMLAWFRFLDLDNLARMAIEHYNVAFTYIVHFLGDEHSIVNVVVRLILIGHFAQMES